jgi:hypothetical protein
VESKQQKARYKVSRSKEKETKHTKKMQEKFVTLIIIIIIIIMRKLCSM